VSRPGPPAPGPNATYAEVAAYLAGSLGPVSEQVSAETERLLSNRATTDIRHRGLVAKNLIVNYKMLNPSVLQLTDGGARKRLQDLARSSRRAVAEVLAQRGVSAGNIADFGAEFTLGWFMSSLYAVPSDWEKPYMSSISIAMSRDTGFIGRTWRGERE
jgi:hypothetical protein